MRECVPVDFNRCRQRPIASGRARENRGNGYLSLELDKRQHIRLLAFA